MGHDVSHSAMPRCIYDSFLCGGNGSGKNTALNVIGEALNLSRDTLYNRSSFFDDYIKLCDFDVASYVRCRRGKNI